MVLSNCVRLDDNVANGDSGPSSSANSCTFHGEIFVMADSALCSVALNMNRPSQRTAPCTGVNRDLMGAPPTGPTDATACRGRQSAPSKAAIGATRNTEANARRNAGTTRKSPSRSGR